MRKQQCPSIIMLLKSTTLRPLKWPILKEKLPFLLLRRYHTEQVEAKEELRTFSGITEKAGR